MFSLLICNLPSPWEKTASVEMFVASYQLCVRCYYTSASHISSCYAKVVFLGRVYKFLRGRLSLWKALPVKVIQLPYCLILSKYPTTTVTSNNQFFNSLFVICLR